MFLIKSIVLTRPRKKFATILKSAGNGTGTTQTTTTPATPKKRAASATGSKGSAKKVKKVKEEHVEDEDAVGGDEDEEF